MYDVAVVGAGINGCCIAYELHKAGKKVVLFDKKGIAQGGSGAAGAFIAPKFSKSGELKEMINDAFVYSMEFYAHNFSSSFRPTKLLHLAKDFDDEEMLRSFKQTTNIHFQNVSDEVYEKLTPEARMCEYICIGAGLVDAPNMCALIAEGIELIKEKVCVIKYDESTKSWTMNNTYKAHHIVLTTGAYESVLREPYIQLRGVWGHRIEITTPTRNPVALHQFVSISPSIDGRIGIGATHNVHYHPEHQTAEYDVQEGRKELLEKAARTIHLEQIQIIKDFTGLRSGSFDYLPLVGPLVDSKQTLACCEKNIRVKRPDFTKFVYHKNLTMMNGSGGYGFVLAPYLAQMLARYIVEEQELDARVVPARFFARWAKRRKSMNNKENK